MMNSRKSMAASAPTFVATNTNGGYRNAGGASVVGQGGQETDGLTFFEREKARLIDEISGGFEELLTSSNQLNRKLEEVLGVGKEFQSVADLWGKFDNLIREHKPDESNGTKGEATMSSNRQPGDALKQSVGVPGTGGRHFGQPQDY